jgi:hypothetical protein
MVVARHDDRVYPKPDDGFSREETHAIESTGAG